MDHGTITEEDMKRGNRSRRLFSHFTRAIRVYRVYASMYAVFRQNSNLCSGALFFDVFSGLSLSMYTMYTMYT